MTETSTAFAVRIDGAWVEIQAGMMLTKGYRDAGGEWQPAPAILEWLASLEPEALAERDIAAIVETERPVGLKVTGSTLEDVEGAPTCVWVTEGYSNEEAGQRRDAVLAQIDRKAGEVILARYADWRQRNMTARAVTLIDIRQERELTPEEAAEREALQAAWAWVDAVRAYSNTLKAAVPSTGQIEDFDISEGWPQ